MASVKRENARKPLATDATVWTGDEVNWSPPKDGFVRATGTDYTLTVSPLTGPDYVVRISENEMLRVCHSWMGQYIRNRKKPDAQS